MPDPWLLLQGMAAAAVVAAGVLLALSRPWAEPSATRTAIGMTLGVALGFLVGCLAIGIWPRWPPREDIDRFLLVLLPALIVVDLLATMSKLPRYAPWFWRGLLSLTAAPILLYNSIYLADLAGPGSREWTTPQAVLILAGLAAALLGAWLGLAALANRPSGRVLPLVLAMVSAAAALTIMLSGYATAGQLGLPLAAALAGVGLASLTLRGAVDTSGAVGVGLVGLFSLLVIGRFFGVLTALHAVLLLTTPLLAWLPEFLPALRLARWRRGTLQIALVILPLIFVIAEARQKFAAASRPAASTAEAAEPSVEDYMNFGK
jgi:hypothetical protein